MTVKTNIKLSCLEIQIWTGIAFLNKWGLNLTEKKLDFMCPFIIQSKKKSALLKSEM